jgi:phospholipid/cholesterol/gamma-HCH transport system permease protein
MRRRVALARALVRRPAVLVADEPTTGLDAASAARVYDLLGELIPRRAMSALIVTHDPACASRLGFPVYYFSPVAGRMPQWTPPPEAATPEARHADLLAWIAHQAQTHQARQADSPAEPAQPSTHVPRAGACLNRMIESLGRLGLLLGGLRPPLNAPAIRRDLLTWGAGALPLTFLIFVLFGAVMQIQAEQAVVEYGFSNELPGLVALSLLRICPFLTGFLLAGRSGSAITARIGGMQLGGQFRALRTMRIEPERALFGPLFWALTLAAPALTAISLGLGALGALAVLASPLSRAKITATFFLSVFPAYLTAGEWLLLLVKAALMGAGLAVIVYGMGARPKRSPEAVSAAITRGLVLSFVWMALVDTMLSLTFQ